MAVNDSDLDLLHAYIDGEMPVSECEGFWRRLSVESDLLAELERMRGDHSIRQAMWATMEPADSVVARCETSILRATRRYDLLVSIRRISSISTAVAACLLFGFTVGWMGRDRYLHAPVSGTSPMAMVEQASQHSSSPTANNSTVYIEDGGHLVAVQQFKSLEEARQFAEDINRVQANQQDTRDSAVVPAVAKF
jgi:hypothetical protein